MASRENDKRITHWAHVFYLLWNVGWFAYIWVTFYNRVSVNTIRPQTAVAGVLIFFIIYAWLCSIYKAFRLASTSLKDIIFAHFISFGIADLILYVESCLVYHHYISIWRGGVIVLIQLAGTVAISVIAKKMILKQMTPRNTLLVEGALTEADSADAFVAKMAAKYQRLYSIDERISETESMERLSSAIKSHEIVILLGITPERRRELIKECTEQSKEFLYDPRIEDILCEGCTERYLVDTPLKKYDFPYERAGRRAVKRTWDIILSTLFLVILSPLMLLTAAAIKIEDGGPVFFRQKRYTKGKKVFEILKFRSMVVNAEALGVTPSTRHDPRVTKVGRVIRATRFDELPQLINVLKGDMSFVGPRPEQVELVDVYEKEMPEFDYRYRVKGGLTGYAQVYGKYNTTPYDKLRLDLTYIENQSFLLDLKIFLLTIRTVFQKESSEGFSDKDSQKLNQEIKEANRG